MKYEYWLEEAREDTPRKSGCKPATSWPDIEDAYREINGENSTDASEPSWIFRADDCGKRPESKLDATLRHCPDEIKRNALAAELWVLRDFQRVAHHHLPTIPENNDFLEWLALIRHYEGPTRLVDWTYSFYAACYFAIARKMHGDVYAVDATALRESANEKIFKAFKGATVRERTRAGFTVLDADWMKKTTDILRAGENESHKRFAWYFLNKDKNEKFRLKQPVIYPVNPFRLNQRLINQQAVFLCPSHPQDLSKPQGTFWHCLTNMRVRHRAPRILRLEIRFEEPEPPSSKGPSLPATRASRSKVLKQLRRMGISAAMLFPDLKGICEGLHTELARAKLDHEECEALTQWAHELTRVDRVVRASSR